jgi:hypothetical protein
VSILQEHRSSDIQLKDFADWFARDLTSNMLSAIRIPLGGDEWFKKYGILYQHLLDALRPIATANQQRFIECMANQYAFMSLDELQQIRRFLRTKAGQRLWELTGAPSSSTQFDCARRSFGDVRGIKVGGWKMIGAVPPPPPPPVP